MGLLLSIMFSYVGAVELAFIVRDIVHQVCLHHQRIEANRSSPDGLEQLQQHIQASLELARERSPDESDASLYMQDGVRYEDGYRVDGGDQTDGESQWMKARAEFVQHEADAREAVQSSPGSGSDDDGLAISTQNSSSSVVTVLENERWNMVDVDKETNEIQSTPLADSSNSSDDRSTHSSPTHDEVSELSFAEYTDDTKRTLDGVSQRPISRNDSFRRRRALKKSNSSSSDSQRQSREEELNSFTSLEEEEFEMIRNSDYEPIKYSSEPNLKPKRNSRRSKRSPTLGRRGMSSGDEEDSARQEWTDPEEVNDPWGDVRPEHFHDTELWRRERAMSIPEIDIDDEVTAPSHGRSPIDRSHSPFGPKQTSSSTFEKASNSDYERAADLLGAPSAAAADTVRLILAWK